MDTSHDQLTDHNDLAILLDERGSIVRDWIVNDPDRLPQPLWLGSYPFWPFGQIQAWAEAGYPRNFSDAAENYVQPGVAGFSTDRPRDPLIELRQILDGNNGN